jgi:transposase-like protein
VLVELGLVEQRYRAVLQVLEGATITDVAKRYGVARQTVHDWLRRYANDGGLAGWRIGGVMTHAQVHRNSSSASGVSLS